MGLRVGREEDGFMGQKQSNPHAKIVFFKKNVGAHGRAPLHSLEVFVDGDIREAVCLFIFFARDMFDLVGGNLFE
jgi:hypothetical protein